MLETFNYYSILDNNLNYKYHTRKNIDKPIYILHELLIEADKYVKKRKKGLCFNYTLTKIERVANIPKPEIYDITFFPKNIQKYIDDTSEYVLRFNCMIKDREITVYFIITELLSNKIIITLNKYIHKIYMWIYVISSMSNAKCSKHITLYLYLTPFEKNLPNNQLEIIDSQHVNSAFTTGCRAFTEIVLFRSEEWFKVFIHETFHNFGLDFSDMNLYMVSKSITEIFNMNIEYNLYESYCETWARIINTMFYTYLSIPIKNKENQSLFINKFNSNMEIESKHSIYQFSKILNFLDLKYDIVTQKNANNVNICNHLYKENTSVFSYYIITGLLINNYKEFMSWCYTNNNIILQFKKTPSNLDKYIELIKKSSTNKHIIQNINNIEQLFVNGNIDITPSMRMSILET